VYAAAFTSFGQECILRLRKPMVRLAFADMLLMWLVQLKSELNVTPRYLVSLVTSSMWLCSVVEFSCFPLFG
jgi:hypothetical protein